MKCEITERPQRVTVVREGVTHTARWRQHGGNDGELFEVHGDKSLLQAVMVAWLGERNFELTDEELVERGGGWWTPVSREETT